MPPPPNCWNNQQHVPLSKRPTVVSLWSNLISLYLSDVSKMMCKRSHQSKDTFCHKSPVCHYHWLKRRLLLFVGTCILTSISILTTQRNRNFLRDYSGSQLLPNGCGSRIQTYSLPFNDNNAATDARNLIMVAGHSVLLRNNANVMDESAWHLLDYQRGQSLPYAILEHIKAGILEAVRDPQSLLVFSGGETRGDGTAPYSEGSSYFQVADTLDLWAEANAKTHIRTAAAIPTAISNVRARTATEEFSTDSFENMLFSICRFKEITGNYPENITLVSFSFKEKRFVELHASALHWPRSRLKYIGKDPPSSKGFDLERASRGEQNNSVQHFEKDPYGCHSKELQKKRIERNPFKRKAPYELSCPEIAGLLKWCGPELYQKEKLPWKDLE